MKIKEIRRDFIKDYIEETSQLVKASELFKDANLFCHYNPDEKGKFKLNYLSFLSALNIMCDITQEQFDKEANKVKLYVMDVLNKDGTFKEYLNHETVEKLKQYFDKLENYNMSDPLPLSCFDWCFKGAWIIGLPYPNHR